MATATVVWAETAVAPAPAAAVNNVYSLHLDRDTIDRGYTVAGFGGALKLSLTPGILASATRAEMIELNEPMPEPWRFDRLSPVYQFEFSNKSVYSDDRPFYIQVAYSPRNNDFKRVFFFDKNYDRWRPLPTKDYPAEGFVRSLIHLPFARLAVFADPDRLGAGRASWYSHKSGAFAASPDFPAGSRLRVTTMDESAFVDVTINDYGPDRSLYPDRVLDLEKNAFTVLGKISEGVVDVKIEPLYIAPDNGRVLGLKPSGAGIKPDITASAAIVFAEDDGKVLYAKNETAVMPLASLTKVVAISVFLEQGVPLDRVAAYSVADEAYNYEHCREWESARVRLKEGDTLTVRDLIYSSLVGSANNTVETLVRISGLRRPDFIALMNQTAADWGATNTVFVEPTGLAPANLTSARDYALITREAFRHELIEQASIAKSYEFTTLNTGVKHKFKNTNRLVANSNYSLAGSKTGYLDEAGYCLMTRVKARANRPLTIVTLGADGKDTSLFETEELIKFGLRQAAGKIKP